MQNTIKLPNLMVDIETFGIGPNAAVASIGAVIFDPFAEFPMVDETDVFNIRVDLSRSRSPGTFDAATVEYWLNQGDEARAALLEEPRVTLGTAIQQFVEFAHRKITGGTTGPGILKMGTLWSNGPTFDESILRAAFTRHDVLFPLHFRGSRCCRTILDIATQLGWTSDEVDTSLIAHSAIDDAIRQARNVVSMVTFLKTLSVEGPSTVDLDATEESRITEADMAVDAANVSRIQG